MKDPAISEASGTARGRPPGPPPAAIRSELCIYCRTDRFVHWPSAIRLSLATCPGCQQRESAGLDITSLDGRPAAQQTQTALTAREALERLPRRHFALTGRADDL
jgi:hypothetical protein